MFPIGGYTKDQVRKLADKFGLPTAKKEESMGICFIGEVPMKEFLQKKIKTKKGKIILNNTKEILGEHDGVPFYTIGQRIGKEVESRKLKVESKNQSLFVIKKDAKKNILFVGYENDPELLKKEIEVGEVNWISGQKPKLPLKCEVRLRHRQPLQSCHCEAVGRGNLIVKFQHPQRAVTPGQFAVLYNKGVCLGGGTIKS
jgi:tRNA-specific 2-thiouridylase